MCLFEISPTSKLCSERWSAAIHITIDAAVQDHQQWYDIASGGETYVRVFFPLLIFLIGDE